MDPKQPIDNTVYHRLAHIRSQSTDAWMIQEASKVKRKASLTCSLTGKVQAKKGGSKEETQNVHPDEGSMELGAPATAQL